MKRNNMLDTKAFEKACECLKTIAHPIRLKMIQMLLKKEYTVGELAKACNTQDHMASEHLSIMKDRGLLESNREGRRVFYKVKEKALASIMKCIDSTFTK